MVIFLCCSHKLRSNNMFVASLFSTRSRCVSKVYISAELQLYLCPSPTKWASLKCESSVGKMFNQFSLTCRLKRKNMWEIICWHLAMPTFMYAPVFVRLGVCLCVDIIRSKDVVGNVLYLAKATIQNRKKKEHGKKKGIKLRLNTTKRAHNHRHTHHTDTNSPAYVQAFAAT